ncbi:hypothetical protein BIY24_10385 [Halobacteriovorax marinus]|uniref:hypothetical protein n=1 Tax=Halobacteriovorax marinus TaxID=97084 RepID=UPI000BC2E058|nr:hypothetical protein [Halobacteriovorax marinus]ATH08340.1 hypothetical protein BIY24_10385 [Halobacteriovorax marinus]
MRRVQNIGIILMTIILMSSCDQNVIGVGHALKNLVTTPYKAIDNHLSNKAYEEVAKSSKEKKSLPTECWVERKSVLPEMQSLQDITDAVRGNVCSCVPWGTCTTAECPCSRMCPEGVDIFKRPGMQSTADFTTKENSLSFINGGGGGSIEATQGFCWGHASVTSKFNRLAFFDKDAKPKYDLFAASEEEQYKAMDYYKELVDDVIDNKPTKIPGIENLMQLSSIPGLEEYIADKVAHEWGKRAMSTSGLSIALKSGAMNRTDSLEFFEAVKNKIDQNQQPQIVFTKRGSAMYTHAVLVSHYIQNPDGSASLCIRDNNRSRGSLSDAKNCSDKMDINRDGSISYSAWGWGNLGGTEVAFNENPDALVQIENLKEHCDKEKGCN